MHTRALRLIATAVAFVVFAVFVPAGPAAGAAGFGDVGGNTFYAAPVQWLVDESITTGTSPGCFTPNRAVTRGEVATFLWRFAGGPLAGSEPFTDVDAGDFFAEPVAWMSAEGITTGVTATTFEPYRAVTRGEVATFLWRFAGGPLAGSEPFTDVDTGDFFAEPVAWMSAEGITTGVTATTFEPYRAVTRGEVATFLYRFAGSPAVTVSTGGSCGAGPTTGSGGGAFFSTLPPGSELPSGEWCASQVKPAAETRPRNTPYNNTVGSGPHPDYPRVDGNFVGTTDEILQWAACKWGIDEDIVRAQTAKESWWDQESGGDLSFDPSACHPSVRHLSPCPESMGILKVRYLYHTPAMDDSIVSTAYNADYTYAVMRSCYNGELTWLNNVERGATYGSGDLWGCLGVWVSGRWYTDRALGYIDAVQDLRAERVWEQGYFLNY